MRIDGDGDGDDPRIPRSAPGNDGETGPILEGPARFAQDDEDALANAHAVAAIAAGDTEVLPPCITRREAENLQPGARARRQELVLRLIDLDPSLPKPRIAEQAGISISVLNRWLRESPDFWKAWSDIRVSEHQIRREELDHKAAQAGDLRLQWEILKAEYPEFYGRVREMEAARRVAEAQAQGVQGENLSLNRRVIASVPKDSEDELEDAG